MPDPRRQRPRLPPDWVRPAPDVVRPLGQLIFFIATATIFGQGRFCQATQAAHDDLRVVTFIDFNNRKLLDDMESTQRIHPGRMAIYEAMVEAHEQGPDAMNSFIQELSDQLDAYSLGCCGTVDGCDCILSAQRYQSGNVRGIHEKPVQFLRETKRYRVSIDKGLRPKMPLCGHLVLVTTPVVFLMLYYLHGFNPRDAFNQRVWKAFTSAALFISHLCDCCFCVSPLCLTLEGRIVNTTRMHDHRLSYAMGAAKYTGTGDFCDHGGANCDQVCDEAAPTPPEKRHPAPEDDASLFNMNMLGDSQMDTEPPGGAGRVVMRPRRDWAAYLDRIRALGRGRPGRRGGAVAVQGGSVSGLAGVNLRTLRHDRNATLAGLLSNRAQWFEDDRVRPDP